VCFGSSFRVVNFRSTANNKTASDMQVPDFKFSMAGRKFSESRGQVVLIAFSATRCKPRPANTPHLQGTLRAVS